MSDYQRKRRSDRYTAEEPVAPNYSEQKKNRYFSSDVEPTNYARPSYINLPKQPPYAHSQPRINKKRRARLVPIFIIMALVAVSVLFVNQYLNNRPESIYQNAQALLSQGEYSQAAEKFESLGSYEDAATLTIYCKACALCESGNFESGITALESLGEYKDSSLRVNYYTARSWDDSSIGTTEFERMEKAVSIYNKNPLYLDSTNRITALEERIIMAKSSLYDLAINNGENGKYDEAYLLFQRLDNYQDCERRYVYYNIREQEESVNFSFWKDADSYLWVAKQYIEMGTYLDCTARATAMTKKANDINQAIYQDVYNKEKSGDFEGAIAAYLSIKDFSDSTIRANHCLSCAYENNIMIPIKYALRLSSVGDTINFGMYEQDNNTQNGRETIEWVILNIDGKTATLISKKILTQAMYNENKGENVSWQKSDLYKWLTQKFYNSAFSADEKKHLVPVYKNDYITILSSSECASYWKEGFLHEIPSTPSSNAITSGFVDTKHLWVRSEGATFEDKSPYGYEDKTHFGFMYNFFNTNNGSTGYSQGGRAHNGVCPVIQIRYAE